MPSSIMTVNNKLKKPFMCFILFMVVISLCSIHNYSCHFTYIDKERMWHELVKKVSTNVTLPSATVCDYSLVLDDLRTVNFKSIDSKYLDMRSIDEGGEYIPQHCKTLFSTAIIIPNRGRNEELEYLVPYLHKFLRTQDIHYRIYVVEQDDEKAFNKGTLLNIASVMAINDGFPCMILHDVDLIPMKYNNIYACTRMPRHMSTTIDVFRYNLLYKELVGGVLSILSRQFLYANGFSNYYWGWGGEDDDFEKRLAHVRLSPVRFHRSVGVYVMMKHRKAIPSPDRWDIFNESAKRFQIDGLNSVNYIKVAMKLRPLYTHIFVKL